jgi:hypothetical protein
VNDLVFFSSLLIGCSGAVGISIFAGAAAVALLGAGPEELEPEHPVSTIASKIVVAASFIER